MRRKPSSFLVLPTTTDKIPIDLYLTSQQFEPAKGALHGKEPLLDQAQTPQPLRETQRLTPHRREHGQNQGSGKEFRASAKSLAQISLFQECRATIDGHGA